MPGLVLTNNKILTDGAIHDALSRIESQLKGHDDLRVITTIVLAPGGDRIDAHLDTNQDQEEYISRALEAGVDENNQPLAPGEREFLAEMRRIWADYDHEELLLLILVVGGMTQLTTIPKPWVAPLHEHCDCGIRKGASAAHDRDHRRAAIIGAAAEKLEELFAAHNVPPSHGIDHARRVLSHARGALDSDETPVEDPLYVAVLLAALLHDADDRKYFETSDYANASSILDAALADVDGAAQVRAHALTAIGFVSASRNGNHIPVEAKDTPQLLYPRWADRLEATGEIGVVRCWEYTLEVGRPLFLEDSPRPGSAEEALRLATPERFAEYQARGESASMIDHYFDKLLHLVEPFVGHPNPYLASVGALRAEPLFEVCVAPRPRALEARLELARSRVKAGAI